MIKKLAIFLIMSTTMLMSAIQPINAKPTESSKKESFGSFLFDGNFGANKKESFNDSYRINNKDILNLIVWGAMKLEKELRVDMKGNVFVPEIGIINVKGKTISEVNSLLQERIKGIYNKNVSHYITVKNYQKINIIVSGEVDNPGMYEGYPTDLIIEYIGQANAITDNGSYRHILIKRNNKVMKKVDLYDFIREGIIDNFQFQDGDVIFVPKKQSYLYVTGESNFNGVFEIKNKTMTMKQLMNYITPNKMVNEYTLTYRNNNNEVKKIYNLADSKTLNSKNTVEFKSNLVKKNISVFVKGEHDSKQHYVLPKNTNLKNFLTNIKFSINSVSSDIRLYRNSIKRQQQDMIDSQVKSMKRTLFQVKSRTIEEEQIRTSEVKRIQGFIEEAAALEPKGQMVIANKSLHSNIYLEDGDIIEIPSKNNLVTVYGEVMFPNTFVIGDNMDISTAIEMCGGFTTNADKDKLFVIKSNGMVEMDISDRKKLTSGDQVVVLQEIDGKFFQLFKDLTQTIYQIALSTGVVLSI